MNSEWAAFVFQIINTSVMNLLIFLFMQKIYHLKYKKLYIYIIAYLLTTVIFISVNTLEVPVVNLLFLFIHVNVLSLILFDSDIKNVFMYNLSYTMWLFFCDVLTVAIWTLLKGEVLKEILTNYQYLSISCLINILIMYFGYQTSVWLLNQNKPTAVRKKELMFLLFITLFEVFVLYSYFLNANDKKDGLSIILILLGFLILNLLVVYIIGEISNAYRDKYELTLVAKQNALQLEHFNEMNRKYEESRKVIHDIKKHLDILTALKGDNEQVTSYSRLIGRQVDSLLVGFQCTNQILSVIMSQKLETAKNNDIRVNTNVMDVKLDFMNDLDITAIFANLWDNAIEANKEVDKDIRLINIIIGQVNNFLVVCMENSHNGIIIAEKECERLLSTKKNHEGLGLSIIKNAVEKYKGNINIDVEEKVFKVDILIPISNVKLD